MALLGEHQEQMRRTARAGRDSAPRGQNGGMRSNGTSGNNDEHLARALGWFSVGLGLVELMAPRALSRLIGSRGDHPALVRTLGMREVASGIGILSERLPTDWVWARVGGDVMDLACLGAAWLSPRADRTKLLAATAAVAGVTALDIFCGQQLSRRTGRTTAGGAVRIHRSITVGAPPDRLYAFWRDFTHLPHFMRRLESVQPVDERRSHWTAVGPRGARVEWDAEITQDRANELIAWRTTEGSDVHHEGAVRFMPATGGRGTVVKVDMHYAIPGGALGAAIATLLGEEPGGHLQDDLRRFKQLIEVGEIVRSEATVQGTGLTEQRPGQPTAHAEARG